MYYSNLICSFWINRWRLPEKNHKNVLIFLDHNVYNPLIKPNAVGKLRKTMIREEIPSLNEEVWLNTLSWNIDDVKQKRLKIIRINFGEPTFTPVEKELWKKIMKYLSNYHPDSSIYLCFTIRREYLGEKKTLHGATFYSIKCFVL